MTIFSSVRSLARRDSLPSPVFSVVFQRPAVVGLSTLVTQGARIL
jgi:hypothetical protein